MAKEGPMAKEAKEAFPGYYYYSTTMAKEVQWRRKARWRRKRRKPSQGTTTTRRRWRRKCNGEGRPDGEGSEGSLPRVLLLLDDDGEGSAMAKEGPMAKEAKEAFPGYYYYSTTMAK